jgi:cysteine-rich repeat protein
VANALVSVPPPTATSITAVVNAALATYVGAGVYTVTAIGTSSTSLIVIVSITVMANATNLSNFTFPLPELDLTAVCGDGKLTGIETISPHSCDDGNVLPEDGCDANCTIEHGWYFRFRASLAIRFAVMDSLDIQWRSAMIVMLLPMTAAVRHA